MDEESNSECKVCGLNAEKSQSGSVVSVNCQRCGKYIIADDAEEDQVLRAIQAKIYLLSGAIRHFHEKDLGPFRVSSSILSDESEFRDKVEMLAPKEIEEKNALLVQHIAQLSPHPGAQVSLDINDYPVAFCRNETELFYLIDHLEKTGLIESLANDRKTWVGYLSPDGWKLLGDQKKINAMSTQGFVAMWFDNSLKAIFNDAIKPAGEETGYTMIRIDLQDFNDKICDRIVAEIRKSRFVIADVTGQRQGVYFEAGYALGLGIPVIWTCRSDEIERCHFDTRQYKHIVWENAEDLKTRLQHRIFATIGSAKSKTK